MFIKAHVHLSLSIEQWFSNRGDFVSKGAFGNIGKHFLLITAGTGVDSTGV